MVPNREGEVGVGEGFVLQREVPPFAIEGYHTDEQNGSQEDI